MKPTATGGTFMPLMKAGVLLVILFSISIWVPAQQQVKKGRWFIGHTIGGPAYETTDYKTYNNAGALTGHTRISGVFFNLSFTAPNWGGISGNGYQQEDVLTGEEIDTKGFSINIQPTAGYFVQDNLMIGASIRISTSGSRTDYTTDNATARANSFGAGIGPLVRYYFGHKTKSKPFVGLESEVFFFSAKQKTSSTIATTTYRNERDQDNKQWKAIPMVGYAWFPGKRWILELQLQYEYNNQKINTTESQFTNNVMNMGYPRKSSAKQTRQSIGVTAGVAFTL